MLYEQGYNNNFNKNRIATTKKIEHMNVRFVIHNIKSIYHLYCVKEKFGVARSTTKYNTHRHQTHTHTLIYLHIELEFFLMDKTHIYMARAFS